MLHRNCRLAAVVITLLAASAACLAEGPGANTYKAKCQMCHGTDGLGATPAGKAMKAVPFNDPAIVHKSDAELIALTKNGKGKMPAYAGKLTDAEITDVIAYVRTLQKK
jgi:mono/diheme cytochrome c family protein